MIYEKATAEVILFDNSDVITASYCDDATSSYDGCLGSDGAGLASYRPVRQQRRDHYELL